MTLQVEAVPLDRLRQAEWNPRTISRERLEGLKASIRDDPSFMWRRPILATTDGTVYAGNQRLLACTELGWTHVPALLEDVEPALQRARSVRDNNTWGEWDDASLATVLAQVQGDGTDVSTTGFDDRTIARLLQEIPPAQAPPAVEPKMLADKHVAPHMRPTGERRKVFEQNHIRQIVLYFEGDDFVRMAGMLADLRGLFGVDNNTDVVARLVGEYHADHCADAQADRPGPVSEAGGTRG